MNIIKCILSTVNSYRRLLQDFRKGIKNLFLLFYVLTITIWLVIKLLTIVDTKFVHVLYSRYYTGISNVICLILG